MAVVWLRRAWGTGSQFSPAQTCVSHPDARAPIQVPAGRVLLRPVSSGVDAVVPPSPHTVVPVCVSVS